MFTGAAAGRHTRTARGGRADTQPGEARFPEACQAATKRSACCVLGLLLLQEHPGGYDIIVTSAGEPAVRGKRQRSSVSPSAGGGAAPQLCEPAAAGRWVPSASRGPQAAMWAGHPWAGCWQWLARRSNPFLNAADQPGLPAGRSWGPDVQPFRCLMGSNRRWAPCWARMRWQDRTVHVYHQHRNLNARACKSSCQAPAA